MLGKKETFLFQSGWYKTCSTGTILGLDTCNCSTKETCVGGTVWILLVFFF